jgi:hypothetical protein
MHQSSIDRLKQVVADLKELLGENMFNPDPDATLKVPETLVAEIVNAIEAGISKEEIEKVVATAKAGK